MENFTTVSQVRTEKRVKIQQIEKDLNKLNEMIIKINKGKIEDLKADIQECLQYDFFSMIESKAKQIQKLQEENQKRQAEING